LTLDETPGEEDVLFTLARIGTTDAEAIVPLSDDIRPCLKTELTPARMAAARCMAIIAEEHPEDAVEAISQLAWIIENEAEAECRKQAVYALSSVTREFPDIAKSHAEVLKAVVLDDGAADTVRLNATAALGRIVSEDPSVGIDIVDELVELFDADNPKLRNNAIGLIADVATVHTDVVEPYVDDIAPLLETDDTFTRINASGALSRVAEDFPAAVDPLTPALIELLNDTDPQARQNACWGLGYLNAEDATANLEECASQDDDQDVRSRASWALSQIKQ
jgi:HEAT repeat protein